MEEFVVLVRCSAASIDDIIEAKQRTKVTVLHAIHLPDDADRLKRFLENIAPVKLLFVLGPSNSFLVETHEELRETLESVHC